MTTNEDTDIPPSEQPVEETSHIPPKRILLAVGGPYDGAFIAVNSTERWAYVVVSYDEVQEVQGEGGVGLEITMKTGSYTPVRLYHTYSDESKTIEVLAWEDLKDEQAVIQYLIDNHPIHDPFAV